MQVSLSTSRADRGVRVLAVADAQMISRELARVGCADIGVRLLTPKSLARMLRLEGVPAPAARILKQEMLAVGGDAALHYDAGRKNHTETDVILLGTEQQLGEMVARMRGYSHGLVATGEAILTALRHFTTSPAPLSCASFTLTFGQKTYVMGILNLTPDSFSGDGLAGDVDGALRRAEQMLEDGADILDVGGESTRPGAEAVTAEEEEQRVIPVVRALAAHFPVPISVDTSKCLVAGAALEAGAGIINDISGLHGDPDMARIVSEAGAAVVVMHMQGTPHTMQQHPRYTDLMGEVCCFLQHATELALAAGIPRSRIILDPGFGFGKTVAHNLELLRRLRELTSYGQPILLGTSRKASIGYILGGAPPEERVEGTAATVAIGIANGADIIRVHDVRQMARVAKMTDAITRGFID